MIDWSSPQKCSLTFPQTLENQSEILQMLQLFTTIGNNVIILPTNLLLSIRVQTTLLASTHHTMPLSLFFIISPTRKTVLFDIDIVSGIKTNQKQSSMVCILINKETCHHSSQNFLLNHCAASHKSTTFWLLWWQLLLLIRAQAMLNYCWFVKQQ